MSLAIGESVEVQGSGAKPYIIKNVDGTIWSCTCPSWRNSGGVVDQKTCKHVNKIRGSAPAASHVILEKAEKEITADKDYAAEVMARAEAEGRKLRQDEKTKLHGPKILLAHDFDDYDIDPTGYWMSEKLDGCRAVWDGKNFISRSGNIFHAPEWFTEDLPKDLMLDGELYMGRQKFQDTMSVVRRLDGGDLWKGVRYMVFDVINDTTPFEERQKLIDNWVFQTMPRYAKHVDQQPCQGRPHLKLKLDAIELGGGEGLMLREPNSMYDRKRSKTCLKVKPWKDDEAEVIGHFPGKGRHKGVVGGLVLRMKDGKEFNIGTGLTDADRKNPPPVGCTITYSYSGDFTKEGIPKCAAFLRIRPNE